MAQRTLPGIGLTGFWPLGYDGWNTENDVNLRLLSALVQARAISRTTALPGSPTDGDIYIVPDGAGSHPNEIAIRDNGAWVYITPEEGFAVYVEDDNENVQFDGTDWQVFGDAGLADAPSDGTLYGRKDAAWEAVPDSLPDAPSDGTLYGRKDGAWEAAAAGLSDAPSDGTLYGRKDGDWEVVPDGGPTSIELSLFAAGELTATELIFRHEATQAFTIPAGMTGSRGSSGVAATGTPALSIKKNGASVGTATWSAAGTTATLAMASPTAFAIGDILSVTGPASPDATLADISLSIVGDL
jgi:hypothetical protein